MSLLPVTFEEPPLVLRRSAPEHLNGVLGAIGSAALHYRSESSCAEVGYRVRSDRTGRGYATSAARMVVDGAFEHLTDVNCVEIRMDDANLASAAVPRKLGFALDRHEDRPVLTSGHTGRGMIWNLVRWQWARHRLG